MSTAVYDKYVFEVHAPLTDDGKLVVRSTDRDKLIDEAVDRAAAAFREVLGSTGLRLQVLPA